MIIFVLLAGLGIIFGSFVNALVWRLHEQAGFGGQRAKGKGQRKHSKQALSSTLGPQDLSITRGRSMCPDCHHTLAAKDLIPVLSWFWLRGKCRYCHKPISWQYPAVELLTGLLFAGSYAAWPYSFHEAWLFTFIVWLACLVFFVALAVYDLRWFLLPDRLVRPLNVLVAVQTVVVALWLHSVTALWQPVLAAAIIFGLFWVLYQASKGAWIGGGDVKLAPALGLLAATPFKTLLTIFFASLLGTLVSIPLLAQGKKGLKLHIPFGPYLLLATAIAVLYGDRIIQWYQNLLLFPPR